MKRSPQMQKLEEILRSSKLVAGGFLGNDPRPLEEIIKADASEVAGLGTSIEEIARRMRELTDLARPSLGTPVKVGDSIKVSSDDTRGALPCPWPHAAHCFKTATTLQRLDTGKTLVWSDLSIHLIREHGFFQGRGSTFRLEPEDLSQSLF